jgi:hypothetical protein
MSTLTNPSVAPLLKRLLAEAAENDAEILRSFTPATQLAARSMTASMPKS